MKIFGIDFDAFPVSFIRVKDGEELELWEIWDDLFNYPEDWKLYDMGDCKYCLENDGLECAKGDARYIAQWLCDYCNEGRERIVYKVAKKGMNKTDEIVSRELLEAAAREGAEWARVKIDGELKFFPLTTESEIDAVIEMLSHFYDVKVMFGDSKQKLGWAYLVFGNEDYTTINDWSDNGWMEIVAEKVNEKF